MKTSLFPLAGLIPVILTSPLSGQSLAVPVLSTPGSATWVIENIGTGTRTVFTISSNTVFDWAGFDLPSGSEMVFDFVGGQSVVNMLNGSGVNILGGNVTSNGNVGFFSPNADLVVTGSITAKSVTLSSLNVDAAAFNSGGTFSMSGTGGFNGLTVMGRVRATGGDVVLAGRAVDITSNARINAKGAANIVGGSQISIAKDGTGRRVTESSGDGFVLHMGDTRASRIEIAAGKQITNEGRLDVGSSSNRIFLEVGQGGKILKEASGIMIGGVSTNGKVDADGSAVGPHEGDSASAVSSSSLKIPALKRPDGSAVSAPRTMVNNTPMSASADTGRDRKRPGQQVASSDKGAKPMLQRASFFGMRGGDTTAKR